MRVPAPRFWWAIGVWTAAGSFPGVASAHAQWARPPESGGRTASLGQPRQWRWQAGVTGGALLEGPSDQLLVRAYLGTSRDLLSPIAGLASIGFEAYGGMRNAEADGGARALFRVPYLSMGIGADFNVRDRAIDLLVTAHSPVRRGGLLTRGSQLRIDWYPLREHSFTVGLSAPLGEPLAGRSQPIKEYVVVGGDFQPAIPYQVSEPELEGVLDSARASAQWIRRLVVPFLDQDGRTAGIALARTERYLRELRAHLAVRSVEEEVRHFHAAVERAFSLAARDDDAGRDLARGARGILLDQVILPYNSLLGRKKRKDTLAELGTVARGRFSRFVVSSGVTPALRTDAVLFVFQRLTTILDEVRATAAKEWDDPRLVWLPLQYALLPEEYDEQGELDLLLERATGVQFSDHNRVRYVANLQFHSEVLRTIRETRDYHVLWIHDFPALTGSGALDWASLGQVVDGYLTTLAERVETYDRTGALPTYFIFLDQHYYEERKSRLLMTVLEDPLRATARLPRVAKEDAERLARAQQRLREAVGGSRVLQAEARQYGDDWLRNRIKVHVNITNRPDPTFWSGGLVGSLFAYPDQLMRDHRKMAFHDVNEADPWAGFAILTGMGVGQHYLGPSWDDRSLAVQGPVLLELKGAVRDLLLSQGLEERDLPLVFRSPPFLSAREIRSVEPDADGFDARALALINGTGFLPKPLNVGKALLYSLLGAGSVLKIPDSLWNSTFYAGLLVGACVRGATASIIAPALANAPSSGFPQMARAHELLTRMLLVRRELGGPIEAAGGRLRTGLYALDIDQRGFASRAETWARSVEATPLLRSLTPSSELLLPVVAEVGDAARGATVGTSAQPAAGGRPRLHQKVQFFATKELWDAIATSPEWPLFMSTYLRYREATYSVEAGHVEAPQQLSAELERIAERMFAPARGTARAAGYAIVGSQNQDYRGMFMDGEVGVLFSGPESLVPLVDLLFMEGTATWVDDQETLDRLLPPVSELMRRFARVIKDAV